MKEEAGAVGVITAAIVAVALTVSVLAVDLGRVVAARAQVSTAADAAALAAAPVTFSRFGTSGEPHREAADVAAANGAELLVCRCPLDRSWAMRQVEVAVAISVHLNVIGDRTLTARAAAEFRPVALVAP